MNCRHFKRVTGEVANIAMSVCRRTGGEFYFSTNYDCRMQYIVIDITVMSTLIYHIIVLQFLTIWSRPYRVNRAHVGVRARACTLARARREWGIPRCKSRIAPIYDTVPRYRVAPVSRARARVV
ncbi:hypothetical protein EVAR_25546_1 [Eumeta japonica]|uniref:Uncharacterized protein n=1 Tax=Eumeta variegata TaxID=151549 RepID=A0A4C1Z6Z9_EUMVA|nr:hypothetical protein EVAR_25546_1 [Eumeta japonica]